MHKLEVDIVKERFLEQFLSLDESCKVKSFKWIADPQTNDLDFWLIKLERYFIEATYEYTVRLSKYEIHDITINCGRASLTMEFTSDDVFSREFFVKTLLGLLDIYLPRNRTIVFEIKKLESNVEVLEKKIRYLEKNIRAKEKLLIDTVRYNPNNGE